MIEIDSVAMVDMILNNLLKMFLEILPVLTPYIESMIVFFIIKKLLCNFWDFINFTSSKLETRRAHKKICNAVEGVSSLIDLADAAKKK